MSCNQAQGLFKKVIFALMNQTSETCAPSDLPMVFILSKGRSGTTLLQTMLDSHPEVIAPLESRFIAHFYHKYGSRTVWGKKTKKEFIDDVLSEMKIVYFWELDIACLNERIEQLPERTTYGAMCKQVYASRISPFKKSTPKVIIDKNPIYSVLIPIISKVYPDARFIQVVRDYRANVSSYFKFQPNQSIRNLGFKWNLYNQKIEKFKGQHPERFYSLRYEDLVEEPEQILKGILDFLKIPFDQKVLHYQDEIESSYKGYLQRAPSAKIREIREEATKQVHANLTKPLDVNLIHSWKRKLSIDDVQILDEVCGFLGQQYGYQEKGAFKKINKAPWLVWLEIEKLYWYYSLPIWFRELKSKPDLGLYKVE